MKKLSIAAVLIACFLSFLLLKIDSRSEQGLLNSLFTEESKDSSPAIEKNVNNETSEKNQSIEETLSANEHPKENKHTEAVAEEQKPNAATKIDDPPAPKAIDKPFLVVIDPGHQAKANLEQEPIGPGAKETKYKVTGGTTGAATGKPEYVLTLEASNLLKSQLEQRGIKVIMTRTMHEVNISNQERAEIANKNGANLFVRIHADGAESAAVNGFSVLVPAKESPYTKSIFDKSYQAGQSVLKSVSAEVPLHQGGIFFRSDMSGFNWSRVPVILPEIGFMTNPEEDRKLSDSAYLTNLMSLLADGIKNYASSTVDQ
ncbi:N-acetylmuramoyl-L-alanine amidase [Pseudobacillus sp. FSL P4-0506]|uniref:N-acetylmuramoyl-L-alanine amidase family protein n=1 Tax=unclassified Pseudobacillus TaxID=2619284 RepID=UPI0030F73E7E